MNTLPPEVHEAFSSAVITTLQELLQVDVSYDDASHESVPTMTGHVVVAIIQLARDQPGSMSFVLAADTAAKLASRYLPVGVALTTEMIDDVAGEIANVIAGQAKTMLKRTPYHFNLSTPTVSRAENGWCHPATSIPNVTLRFNCELGEFILQANFIAADTR